MDLCGRPTASPTRQVNERHRLVTSENGSGGSSGNRDARELLAAAADLLDVPPVASHDPTILQSSARQYQVLTQQAIELENAAAELREAQRAAAVVRRRVLRAERSAEKAAQRDALREAGRLYTGESRSPNRPVHVVVDPRARETAKADAIRRRQAVGLVVAALVNEAVDRPLDGYDRGQRERSADQRATRFARLFLDEDTWRRFRVTAGAAGLSAARAVGAVVETEARRLGWRAPSSGHDRSED